MRKRTHLVTTVLLSLGLAGAQSAPTLMYLGPVGTYSDAVAQAVSLTHHWTPTLASSITEVSNLVTDGKAPYGLIPIENSSGGYVAETSTILAKPPSWRVIAVADLPIDNMLLVNPGTKASDITTIVSHPQPFLQSATYLKTNFPNVKRVEAKSTAAAAEMVARDGGKTMAAIAAPAAAGVYKLNVLAARIQDDQANTTRFFVVQHDELSDQAAGDHALVYLRQSTPETFNRVLRGMMLAGMNFSGMLSAPSGKLDRENALLFFEGRHNTAAQLRPMLSSADATLTGLYGAPVQIK